MRIELIFNEQTRNAAAESMVGSRPHFAYDEPDYDEYNRWAQRYRSIRDKFLGPIFENAKDYSVGDTYIWIKDANNVEYYYLTSTVNRVRIGDR